MAWAAGQLIAEAAAATAGQGLFYNWWRVGWFVGKLVSWFVGCGAWAIGLSGCNCVGRLFGRFDGVSVSWFVGRVAWAFGLSVECRHWQGQPLQD